MCIIMYFFLCWMRVNSCNKLPSISPANAVREIHFGHILENADVLLKTEDISLSSFTCFYVLLCILSCLLGRGSREQTDVKTGFFWLSIRQVARRLWQETLGFWLCWFWLSQLLVFSSMTKSMYKCHYTPLFLLNLVPQNILFQVQKRYFPQIYYLCFKTRFLLHSG